MLRRSTCKLVYYTGTRGRFTLLMHRVPRPRARHNVIVYLLINHDYGLTGITTGEKLRESRRRVFKATCDVFFELDIA